MKDDAIRQSMASIENRVRHVYNQGFEAGRKAERKTMTHEEAVGFLQESGWLQDHDKQIYEQGKRDVKPVMKYTLVDAKYDFVTSNRGAQRTSDIVLKILERLYNDFTMRRDEERALDWAMNFIREHRKEGE